MKRWFYIGIVLLVAVVGCKPPTSSPRPSPGGEGGDSPALTGTPNPPDPLSKGEGLAHKALEEIDSLMWWRADSALAVMMEFAGSPEADSLDAFNGHYCQVLVAELLFKNYYAQSNRTEVLKAVGYFDSIDDGFLAARAHYIIGRF